MISIFNIAFLIYSSIYFHILVKLCVGNFKVKLVRKQVFHMRTYTKRGMAEVHYIIKTIDLS